MPELKKILFSRDDMEPIIRRRQEALLAEIIMDLEPFDAVGDDDFDENIDDEKVEPDCGS